MTSPRLSWGGTGEPTSRFPPVLVAVMFSGMVFSMLQTMVVPLLGRFASQLDVSLGTASFLITGQLLSAAVLTPVLGRVGDLYGKRPVLIASWVVTIAGCGVSAIGTSYAVVLLGRVMQGAGMCLFPLAPALLRDELPAHRLRGAIAAFSATASIGGSAGLIFAGLIAAHGSGFRGIFVLGGVLLALGLVTIVLWVPGSSVRHPGRVDVVGAVLLGGFVLCLLLPLSEGSLWGWTSSRTLLFFAAAVLLGVAWVVAGLRTEKPLVDMRLLASPAVLTTNLAAVCVGVTMFGGFVVIVQFVQVPPDVAGYGFGADVLHAGLFMIPSTLCGLMAVPLVPLLARKLDTRAPITLGACISATAMVLLSTAHSAKWQLYVLAALNGVGTSLAFASFPTRIVDSVPASVTGVASGINAIMRSIGQSIGGALIASLLAARTVPGTSWPHISGYRHAMLLSASFSVVAAIVVWLGRGAGERRGRPARVALRQSGPVAVEEPVPVPGRGGVAPT